MLSLLILCTLEETINVLMQTQFFFMSHFLLETLLNIGLNIIVLMKPTYCKTENTFLKWQNKKYNNNNKLSLLNLVCARSTHKWKRSEQKQSYRQAAPRSCCSPQLAQSSCTERLHFFLTFMELLHVTPLCCFINAVCYGV